MIIPNFRSSSVWVAVALAWLLLGIQGGCGSNGPTRYSLSGKVTYGGQPVAAGTMLFEPDTSQGNRGPGTFVEFTEGRYETRRGKGTVGGPHIVRIVGYSGTPDPSGEAPQGLPVFSEYIAHVDLPRETAIQDFEIPGDHR